MVRFTVAALSRRRILLKKKPAVIDRRYHKTKFNHYPLPGPSHHCANSARRLSVKGSRATPRSVMMAVI